MEACRGYGEARGFSVRLRPCERGEEIGPESEREGEGGTEMEREGGERGKGVGGAREGERAGGESAEPRATQPSAGAADGDYQGAGALPGAPQWGRFWEAVCARLRTAACLETSPKVESINIWRMRCGMSKL